MTYYLDEMTPGLSETFSKTVTESDIRAFGEATGDKNPVHFDESYAATTVFKGRIVHGVLSVGIVSALLGMKLPGPGTIFVGMSVKFVSPVHIGETVAATCTLREMRGKRQAVFDCVCKVGSLTVLEGEAVVIPPKRPKGA
jgi:3-hydroxybutyryl-CoA dehydratase